MTKKILVGIALLGIVAAAAAGWFVLFRAGKDDALKSIYGFCGDRYSVGNGCCLCGCLKSNNFDLDLTSSCDCDVVRRAFFDPLHNSVSLASVTTERVYDELARLQRSDECVDSYHKILADIVLKRRLGVSP